MCRVIDSADKRRLEDCKQELKELLKEERLAGASLLILANKQDLVGAMDPKELRSLLQLDDLISSSHHYSIVPCSAVTAANLDLAIDWIVMDVASRIFSLN